jgi:hypothetical protein
LDVSEGFSRETEFWKENSGRYFGRSIVTISGEEIGEDIFVTRKILNLEVTLGEYFPPAAEASIMGFE